MPCIRSRPHPHACGAVQRRRAAGRGTAAAWVLSSLLGAAFGAVGSGPAQAADAEVLHIVGGLAGVNQFTRHEEPFWTQTLPRLTGGRYRAEIAPFDRAGLSGADLLSLVRSGSVPFANVLTSAAATKDPELMATDLPGQNPDLKSLQRTVQALRPSLQALLRERYGAELLAVYTYPAQVLFCKQAWAGLDDLKGRRIRTSSVAQNDWVQALGGKPVLTPFAEVINNARSGNIDCAITGTMSGNTIGLHEVTTHVHSMAVNWGVSVFVANGAVWRALPADLRRMLEQQLPRLEDAIWKDSDRETFEGIACNTGSAACAAGRRGRMVEVRPTRQDEQRRRDIFTGSVLPQWMERCGTECRELWNKRMAPSAGSAGSTGSTASPGTAPAPLR